ncbi:MAG: hypothetical protein AAF211_00720 [Myxococcota bacterium]
MIVWAATVAVAVEPHIDADPYVPTVDVGPFAAVDTVAPVSTVVAAQSSWAVAPLRAIDTDGRIQPVIRQAWAWHFGARHTVGPVRLGLSAPVYPVRVGSEAPRVLAVVGDPQLEAVAAWEIGDFRVGGRARLGASLGATTRQLGYPGAFGDLGVIGVWTGPVVVAANLGVRITPTLSLVDAEHDDAFWFDVGVAVPLVLRWTLAVEASGSLARRGLTLDTAPVELLANARYRASDTLAVLFGAGRGVSPGVGAPALRVVAGLRFVVAGQGDRVRP